MKKPRKTKQKLETKRRKPSKLSSEILKAKPAKQEAALRQIEKRIAAGDKLTRSELKIYYELEKIGNPETIRDVKEAAKYTGMSARVIRYANSGGRLKSNPNGTFERAEIDRWVKSRDGREKSPEDADISKKDKKARAEYWVEKAKKERLIRKSLEGSLAEWSYVKTEWSKRAINVKSNLYSFTDRLPPLLVGRSREEIRDILLAEVTEILKTYYKKS